jgi:hypothetical protein
LTTEDQPKELRSELDDISQSISQRPRVVPPLEPTNTNHNDVCIKIQGGQVHLPPIGHIPADLRRHRSSIGGRRPEQDTRQDDRWQASGHPRRRRDRSRDSSGPQPRRYLVEEPAPQITGHDWTAIRAEGLRRPGAHGHDEATEQGWGRMLTSFSSHNHTRPLSWFTRYQSSGHTTGWWFATEAAVLEVTPRSSSTPTSQRLPSAATAETHSYVPSSRNLQLGLTNTR